jgi:hypothetical protein
MGLNTGYLTAEKTDESNENYPVRLPEYLGKLCILAYENGYSPKLRLSKTQVFPEYIRRIGD